MLHFCVSELKYRYFAEGIISFVKCYIVSDKLLNEVYSNRVCYPLTSILKLENNKFIKSVSIFFRQGYAFLASSIHCLLKTYKPTILRKITTSQIRGTPEKNGYEYLC